MAAAVETALALVGKSLFEEEGFALYSEWPGKDESLARVREIWKDRVAFVQGLRRSRRRQYISKDLNEKDICTQAVSGVILGARLSTQLEGAEGRLSELVAECRGEREKSIVACKAKSAMQHAEWKEASAAARLDAAWDFFLLRLEFESGGLLRSSSKDPEVIQSSRRALPQNQELQPVRCATLHKLGSRRLSARGGLATTKNGFFFDSAQALADALSTQKTPKHDASTSLDYDQPLLVKPIAWLALAAPEHCFELESIGLDKSLVRSRIFYKDQDLLKPATLRHLLESKQIAQSLALGADNTTQLQSMLSLNSIPALYVFLGATPLHNDGSDQRPRLSPVVLKVIAVRLLLETYAPHLVSGSASSVAHLALSPQAFKSFSLVKVNTELQLVAWSSSLSTPATNTGVPHLPCDWRACSAPATVWLKRCGLCEWHARLKIFLDSDDDIKNNHPDASKKKASQSSRVYLSIPKRGGSTNTKQIDSALLKELSDGKLAATVRTFCSRAIKESLTKSTRSKPRWLRWADNDALAKAKQSLDRSLKVAETLAAIERACAAELTSLAEIGKLQNGRVLESLHRQRQRFDQGDARLSDDDLHLSPGDATPLRNEERLELGFARAKLSLLRAARNDDDRHLNSMNHPLHSSTSSDHSHRRVTNTNGKEEVSAGQTKIKATGSTRRQQDRPSSSRRYSSGRL